MERAKPKKNIGPGTAKTVAQAKLVKAPKCGVAMPKASSRSSSFNEPRWLLAVIEQHRKPPRLSLLLLPFRQPARRVIRLAVQLLHLFHKARPIIAFGVRERPRLAFIVPAIGVEPLRLFVMTDRGFALTGVIKMFGQSELGRRQRPIGVLRREALFQFLFAQGEGASFAVRRPIADGVQVFRGFKPSH